MNTSRLALGKLCPNRVLGLVERFEFQVNSCTCLNSLSDSHPSVCSSVVNLPFAALVPMFMAIWAKQESDWTLTSETASGSSTQL